jgi:hypothetical protein
MKRHVVNVTLVGLVGAMLCAPHVVVAADPISVISEAVDATRRSAEVWDSVRWAEQEPSVARDARTVRTATVATLHSGGDPANRIDIVVIGDGYTVDELDAYRASTDALVAGMFTEEPFDRYRDYFNVHRVDVVSAQSGIDRNDDDKTLRDTALGMGVQCPQAGGTIPLCIDTTAALVAAAQAPAMDEIVALANSTSIRGIAYVECGLAALTAEQDKLVGLALHELGHSFGGLADEYSSGNGEGSVYTGADPDEPNVSVLDADAMAEQSAKWFRWLGADGVGTWEGAKYYDYGLFRPTDSSRMRAVVNPFGVVNREALVASIYRRVQLIDAATAPGIYDPRTELMVETLQPRGQALAIRWYVDGEEIGDLAGASRLRLDQTPAATVTGRHEVEVVVTDTTDWVRDESLRDTWMTQRRQWLVDVAPGAVHDVIDGVSADADGIRVRISGNATGTITEFPGRAPAVYVESGDAEARVRILPLVETGAAVQRVDLFGDANMLVLDEVDLRSGLAVHGMLRKLELYNVWSIRQQRIRIDEPWALRIKARSIRNAHLDVDGMLDQLSVTEWLDDDDEPDRIHAANLSHITVRGDFEADVDVDYGTGSMAPRIKIKGSLREAAIRAPEEIAMLAVGKYLQATTVETALASRMKLGVIDPLAAAACTVTVGTVGKWLVYKTDAGRVRITGETLGDGLTEGSFSIVVP